MIVIYRVTIHNVLNLPLTPKQRLCFNTCAAYKNETFVLMSTGGWEKREWSPCRWVKKWETVFSPRISRCRPWPWCSWRRGARCGTWPSAWCWAGGRARRRTGQKCWARRRASTHPPGIRSCTRNGGYLGNRYRWAFLSICEIAPGGGGLLETTTQRNISNFRNRHFIHKYEQLFLVYIYRVF